MSQRAASCLNCGAPTPDEYCSRCGQKNADYREGLREIVGEVAQELFQFDSRIAHTAVPFLFQPGKLTAEWAAGRRTHYSSPLRIFLLLSVAYFFALSLKTGNDLKVGLDVTKDGVSVKPLVVPDGGVASVDAGAASLVDGGATTPAASPETSLLWRMRQSRFAAKEAETPKARAERMLGFMTSAASKTVFVLMPLFALLLQLLFWRARRYYVEHLVFAVHFHSFVFALLLVGLVPLHVPLFGAFCVLSLLYLTLAIRRVYRPTLFQLAWKLVVLVVAYSILLGVMVSAVALAAIGLA